ncbi:hypothetical protein VCRA2123E342_30569 [Vibrio crassostreae]|nr:hypothetical protein VCRA2123E342_30569 [Vibrio crassostreae]
MVRLVDQLIDFYHQDSIPSKVTFHTCGYLLILKLAKRIGRFVHFLVSYIANN